MDLELDGEMTDEEAADIQGNPELSPWFWVTKENGAWIVRVEYDPDSEQILEDTTLHARWDVVNHAVSFNANGGDGAPASQQVTHGDKAQEPDVRPTRTGYNFTGWYRNKDCGESSLFSFDATITNDYTLYAGWQPEEYLVYVVDDDGEASDIQIIPYGQKVARPAEPQLAAEDAYLFGGWYANEDLTLRTRWKPREYTVTFVDEDGDEVFQQKVLGDTKATDIEADGWAGLNQVDWFADSGLSIPFDFDAPITQDATVYGLWNSTPCTVTFDSNGGSDVNPKNQEVACGDVAVMPEDPVWVGHTFLGWYEDVTNQISPDELEEYKEWLLQALADNKEDDPDGESVRKEFEDIKDGDFDNELVRQELQKLNDDFVVVDGKTLTVYDPATNPVYYDMTALALWSEGSLVTEVVLGEGAPKVTVENFNEAGLAILTPEEIEQGAVLRLTVNRIEAADASDADKTALAAKLDELGATDGAWLDISLAKIVAGVETKLESIPVPLKLSVEIPESMRADGRTYYLFRAHGGEASEIAEGTQDVIVGESGLFSTYLLAYKDAKKNVPNPEGAQDNNADETSESTGATGTSGTSGTTRTATPRTSDGTSVTPLAMTVLAIIALLAAVAMRKKA